MLEESIEVAVALATQADETDADKLAGRNAGGSLSFVEENVGASQAQANAQSGIASSAQESATRKSRFRCHARFITVLPPNVNGEHLTKPRTTKPKTDLTSQPAGQPGIRLILTAIRRDET